MEDVLKQWSGAAYNLAPMPLPNEKGTSFGPLPGGEATMGALLLDSGTLPLPQPEVLPVGELHMTPRIKSAPQLTALIIEDKTYNDPAAAKADSELTSAEEAALLVPLQLPAKLVRDQAGCSESQTVKGWAPRAPHTGMRSSLAVGHGRFSKQAVSFAPGPSRREGTRAPTASLSPRRSVNGTCYDDSEMEQLAVTDSCCAPFAAGSPLAVSNCHTLRFLAASGTLQGQQEDFVGPRRHAQKPRHSKSSSPNKGLPTNQDEELSSSLSMRSNSSSTIKDASPRTSLGLSTDTKGAGLASSNLGGMS